MTIPGGVACRLVALAWMLNVGLLFGTAGWVLCDGRCPRTSEALVTMLTAPTTVGSVPRSVVLVRCTAIGAVVTLSGVLVGLIRGPGEWRGVRVWLLATALVSVWCTLLACWPMLYWRGQLLRAARLLPPASSLARTLTVDWPQDDGELTQLGHFLAYPKPQPSTLILLGDPCLEGSFVGVASVEKVQDGALALELTGPEAGAWLELRQDRTEPRSFVGGLRTSYNLIRGARLSSDWWLVRYEVERAPNFLAIGHSTAKREETIKGMPTPAVHDCDP